MNRQLTMDNFPKFWSRIVLIENIEIADFSPYYQLCYGSLPEEIAKVCGENVRKYRLF